MLTEHLSACKGVDLRVLGDSADYRKIAEEAGPSWECLRHYCLNGTHRPNRRVGYFLAKTFSMTGTGRRFRSLSARRNPMCRPAQPVGGDPHDAAHLEPSAHRGGLRLLKHRVKWNCLYRVLERKADIFPYCLGLLRGTFWRTSGQACATVCGSFRMASPTASLTAIGRALAFVRKLGSFLAALYCCVRLDHRKNGDLVLAAWRRFTARSGIAPDRHQQCQRPGLCGAREGVGSSM